MFCTQTDRDCDMKVRFTGEDQWVEFNMDKYPCIPNHSLDLLDKFVSTDSTIPRLDIIKGNARRHKTQLKKSETFDPTKEFDGAYTNIFKTTGDSVTHCYDVKPSSYRNTPKVVLMESGKYPVYDDGKYGVSDQCFWMEVSS